MKLAIYPGTFDPITNGHLYIIERSLAIFDNVTVAVAKSPKKQPLFSVERRVEFIRQAFADDPRVQVESFDSLLVEYARARGASVVLRGLRAVSDFEYELQMALMNKKLENSIETVFMMPSLRYIFLSSTIVKEAATFGGDVSGLVPDHVRVALAEIFGPPHGTNSDSARGE